MSIGSNQGFSSEEIWTVINNFSESSLKKKVASAYLGKSVVFKWNLGDVLLIGLSEKNVVDGLIDLEKVEEIINLGVKVYKKENLHSKIYFNKEMVIVCSCNLSMASQNDWLEAGIYTSDSKILQSVNAFFKTYACEDKLVTKEELEKLRMVKKGKSGVKQEMELSNIKAKVWVLSTISSGKEDPITEMALNVKKMQVIEADENEANWLHIKLDDPHYFDIQSGDFVIGFTGNHSECLLFPLYKCIQASFINDNLYYINLKQKKGHGGKKWEDVKSLFDGFDLQNYRGELINNKDKIIQEMLLLFSF
jgi:hypothetical protein